MNYSRSAGSKFPDRDYTSDPIFNLVDFKDLTEASTDDAAIIKQIYQQIQAKNFDEALALYQDNSATLAKYEVTAEIINLIKEEVLNVGTYVIANGKNYISDEGETWEDVPVDLSEGNYWTLTIDTNSYTPSIYS